LLTFQGKLCVVSDFFAGVVRRAAWVPLAEVANVGTMLAAKAWQSGDHPMPRYFFDVKDGHRLFDSAGFVCDDDVAAIIRATILAIGISLDKPEDDPERRVAVINDEGREIGTVPVYSKPSYDNPAR
jgi:hypothetical protein